MSIFEVTTRSLATADVDVIAITATSRARRGDRPSPAMLGPGADVLAEASGVDLDAQCKQLRFTGKAGATIRIPLGPKVRARELLIVGLGDADKLDAAALRSAAAAVARATSDATTVATSLAGAAPDVDAEVAAQVVVEGFLLAAYRFATYKRDKDAHQVTAVALHVGDSQTPAPLKRGVEVGEAMAEAVALVRDLVNTPPGDKRPPAFADRVLELVQGTKVRAKVLDAPALRKGGYGGILGVGQGSSEDPRLVELTYTGTKATKHIALVGKGITFDSGGLSLKPSESMETMKMDMAGAATVLATIMAVARLRLPIKVTAVLALAENMPSGTAIRVSDVLTMKGGKTVEVMNTDAEGRLVLADALVHVSAKKPDAIVDVATLTGAVLVALGKDIGAVLATDDALADALLAATAASGEHFWRLPLAADLYADKLTSEVADLRNSGWGREAGTLMAGLFLKEFVPDSIPWAHLDIAGLAWTDKDAGVNRKGSTGSPVRTLVEWLRAV